MTNLRQIVTDTIALCKANGAQDAFVSLGQSHSMSVSWRKGRIEKLQSAGASALHVQLFVDGRFSAHSTSDLRSDSISRFVERGIAMTRLLEPDPFRGLADPARYEGRTTQDLELFDSAVNALTPADLVSQCQAIEALAQEKSDLPIEDITSSYGAGMRRYFEMSTNGFEGEMVTTSANKSCSIVLNDDGKKPSDYGSAAVRHVSDFPEIGTIVDEAAAFARLRLGQKKLPSRPRTLILDRRVARQLVSSFLSPLSGYDLVAKRSYFEGKIGANLGSGLLTLVDMPHLVRGLGSSPYDDEGMATRDATIFDKGVLKQYLLDNYCARKLDLEATSGSLNNLVMPKGERSLAAMIADVKDGIYVIGLLGGNKDNLRGDFSHGIVGVAIENGELTTPISEMNIDGNFTNLWQRLVEVGNDPSPYANYLIPSLRIDDVSVSGT
ncbi:MAG: TldD/PmbA family protein [Proteobacteria bacterium]|nr:TldD/PmbA family protein [Pseudomonadota bacterium]